MNCQLSKNNVIINLMKYSFPKHFYFATTNLGKKKGQGDNLLLITSERPAVCAGVFTNNSFCGAPVIVSKKYLKASPNDIRAVLVNSGVANVATGEQGIKDAQECAKLASVQINCSPKALKQNSSRICTTSSCHLYFKNSSKYLDTLQDFSKKSDINLCAKCKSYFGSEPKTVLVASTGVIGQFLPMDKMRDKIPDLLDQKNQDAESGARAIMTTDTVPKIAQSKVGKATILGIAKGVGMIEPNMATMLSFVITDAKIAQPKLQKIWSEITSNTFNMLSVDSCESTSDMALVLANGEYTVNEKKFAQELYNVAESLTRQLARDGEGATILIETVVKNAQTKDKAKILAKSVIKSDLVKTAVHGRDANWGRIIQAMGATKIKVNADKLVIKIDNIVVFKNGAPAKKIDEAKIFQKDSTKIEIDLNNGKAQATAWGCDLSKEYISINADYRS